MKKHYFLIWCAVLICSCFNKVNAQVPILQTVAGNGSGGSSGDLGQAFSAQLNANYFIALNAAGTHLYIADGGNFKIRKIDLTTGIITTFAGTGVSGYFGDGGPATAARFGSNLAGSPGIVGIAVDLAENVYVCDATNNVVRKINTAGVISTVAGTGTAGFFGDGGPAVAAFLSQPRGVAVDALGNLYITDAGNFRVRFVNVSSGNIATICGTGTSGFSGDGFPAVTAQIASARGITVDAGGNVYIADNGNNCIRMITFSTGNISTIAGIGGPLTFGNTGDGGLATLAKLNQPTDMKFDAAGNMYITDFGNHRVRMVNPGGVISAFAASAAGTSGFGGDGGTPTAAAALMMGTASIAITPAGNYFYISDRTNDRIRLVKPNSTPYFNLGSRQALTVCQNSGANAINTQLAIVDTDRSQTESWSIITVPVHGTLSVAGTSVSNGGLVTPTAKTYTPTLGYSGIDSFIVQVSDGFATSKDTIIVTVNPLPVVGAISGATSLCEASTITLTDTSVTGGWSSSSNARATVTAGGVVRGVSAGTVVISYTVTNACGPTSSVYTLTINPLPVTGSLIGSSQVCVGSSILLTDVGGGAGVWSSTASGVATVDAAGNVSGSAVGTATISYTVTNGCGTAAVSQSVDVITLPSAGVISGASVVCQAASVTLSESVAGGAWTGTTGNAFVAGPVISGVTTGTEIISYSVTNLCGTSVATYPLTVNPLPVAGTISGPSAVCLAGTIILTDAAPGGVWLPSNTNASVAGGVVTGAALGTCTISYSVTNSCGTAVATQSVTIIGTPTAGTITGPTSVCATANITLSNLVGGGIWSVANTHASVSGTGVVTGLTGGVDTVIYTVSYSCGTANAMYTVTINPLADPGTVTGSSFVCVGATTTVADVITTGIWSVTNANATISSAGVVTGVTGGPDTVKYGVTNGCGIQYATLVISVNAILTPSVTLTATPGFSSCLGNAVTYIANPTNGGTAPVYQWSVNGVAASTGSSFIYTPANGDVVTVELTSSANCLSVLTDTASHTIAVKPFLAPAVSISTGPYGDTVCVGTLTPFTPVPVNAGTVPTYQWSVNGIPMGAAGIFNYIPANGDVITCDLTSSYLCPLPPTATSNSITMTVDISEIPVVTVTASPGSSVCAGSPVTLSAHPLYGGVPPSFRWTKNGINVATGPNYSYVPHSGDNVYCMMHSNSTCIATGLADTVFSSPLLMSTVTPVTPTVVITSSPSGVAAVGDNIIFSAVASPVTATTAYQWYVNGSAVAGANTATYTLNSTVANTSLVNCVVSSGDVCNINVSSNLLSVAFVTGIRTLDADNSIVLLPNPNKGSFSIEGTISSDYREVNLQVMNVVGQVVYSSTASVQNGVLNQAVQLNGELANGVYLLHLTAGDEHKVIRFSVSK